MSVDERDEPYATLPDLGHQAPALLRAREAERARTRAAIADLNWHTEFERRHRRDWLYGYLAAAAALTALLVAILTVRETYAALAGAVCVAAIVASASRSGTRVNAERAHASECTRRAS